jgi:hypothetical protein
MQPEGESTAAGPDLEPKLFLKGWLDMGRTREELLAALEFSIRDPQELSAFRLGIWLRQQPGRCLRVLP